MNDGPGYTPETAEQAYRRGYRDGWIMAIDAITDPVGQMSKKLFAAYKRCAEHGDAELLDWMRKAEQDNRMECPPMVKGT